MNVAQEAIFDWQRTKDALAAASVLEANARKTFENASLITEATASAVRAKHDVLKTIQRHLIQKLHGLDSVLSRIESDMSRANLMQDAGNTSEDSLAGLNQEHNDVTKLRDEAKDQIAQLVAVLPP